MNSVKENKRATKKMFDQTTFRILTGLMVDLKDLINLSHA